MVNQLQFLNQALKISIWLVVLALGHNCNITAQTNSKIKTAKTTAPAQVTPVMPVATSSNINSTEFNKSKIIKNIILDRHTPNRFLTDEAILSLLPYYENEFFNPAKTSTAISKLYDFSAPFGYFDQIKIMGELLDDHSMNLHVVTYEKPILTEVVLEGNKQIKFEDLDKELKFAEIHALNQGDIKRISAKIVDLYREKDFHQVVVNAEIRKDQDGLDTILVLKITENSVCLVKKVRFKGNHQISAKQLRGVIFTREDWILGVMNKSGKFVPENLDMDRHLIEGYYRSHGYMKAHVDRVQVDQNPDTGHFKITFHVTEGDLYTINSVQVEGNEILPTEQLLEIIQIKPGDIYSIKAIRESMEDLRTMWGRHGYIFADISPAIVPDEERKTVDIAFNFDLGGKVRLNRVNIIGNKKTRDAVVRRNLLVEEGEVLTSIEMDLSKTAVARLGYFDFRDGVNWKINRIGDDEVDLDLVLKEVNTGKLGFQMDWGGTPRRHGTEKNPTGAPGSSVKINTYIRDLNLFGQGYFFDVNGTWSKQEWGFASSFMNPYTFDRPLMTRIEGFFKTREFYNELHSVDPFHERRAGVTGAAGFDWNSVYFGRTKLEYLCSLEKFSYGKTTTGVENRVIVDRRFAGAALLQDVLDRQFQSATMVTFENIINQDYRNRGQHPSGGHKWLLDIRSGFSADKKSDYGFYKFDFDTVWYNQLIERDKLVLALHLNAGLAKNIGSHGVPYMELFHVGGPDSVRGFFFGEIGPMIGDNSIGSTKSFIINAELLFPLAGDMVLKGVLFYDGGSGWGVANQKQLEKLDPGLGLITHKNFDYRQSIGFGIRMTQPQPIRVDWGFKLDRRPGESAGEVHFSTYREF
ncbi:MAG TPA: outer membrane protein assembly factor BamA [Candidatus Babeliales bacterium]|nr:outer membrane protein assembly factor BamA [Candidatus Babeliales bacterium]